MVSRYEEPYQPTSLSELKTVVMRGMAVAMMVLSSAMTKVDRQRPKVRMANGKALGYLDSSSSPGAPAELVVVAADGARPSSWAFSSSSTSPPLPVPSPPVPSPPVMEPSGATASATPLTGSTAAVSASSFSSDCRALLSEAAIDSSAAPGGVEAASRQQAWPHAAAQSQPLDDLQRERATEAGHHHQVQPSTEPREKRPGRRAAWFYFGQAARRHGRKKGFPSSGGLTHRLTVMEALEGRPSPTAQPHPCHLCHNIRLLTTPSGSRPDLELSSTSALSTEPAPAPSRQQLLPRDWAVDLLTV